MNGFLSFNRIISETATTFAASLDQSSKVLSDIQSCTREHKNTYCYSARSEDVESAHELGLSYGKYKAFLELQSLNPDITVSDIQNMTMREIKDLTDKLSANGRKSNSNPRRQQHGRQNRQKKNNP